MKNFILAVLLTVYSTTFAQLDYSWTNYTRGWGPNDDYPAKIKMDQNSYAYVVGTTSRIDGTDFSGENIAVKKYDRFGNSIKMLYNYGDFKQDNGKDIAIDAYGNMYVLGLTQAMNFDDGLQMIILKYAQDGTPLIQKIIYSRYMDAASIVVDETGNCYVLGSFYDSFGKQQCLFMGLNSAFETIFSNVFSPAENYVDVKPKNIVWKGNFLYLAYNWSNGGTYLSKVSKYTDGGVYQWERNVPLARTTKICVDNSFNLYVGGTNEVANLRFTKYNANGDFLYQRIFDNAGECTDMAIDNENKNYVVVTNPVFDEVTTYKFDDTPIPIWTNTVIMDSPTSAYMTLTGKCVFVTAMWYSTPFPNVAIRTTMIDKISGSKLLDNNNYATQSQVPIGIVADEFGHCFVATSRYTNDYGIDWMTFGMHYPLHTITRPVVLPGLYDFTVPGPGPELELDAPETIASINVSSLTGTGNISVNFTSAEPLNTTFTGTAPANISSYSWYISKDNTITAINAEVRFDYTQIQNAGITNPADVKIYKRDVSGTGDFTELPTTIIGTEIRATVTTFGEFIFGSATQPLPVELSSFVSIVNQNSVELKWSTKGETNNKGFAIERKNAEGQFEELGFVNGNGTSSAQHNYSFKDNNLSAGKYIYRLKQTDYNGNFKYFELSNEAVIGMPVKYFLSQNYPNPFNPSTKINFEIPKAGFVSLNIYDISGKLMHSLVNEVKNAGYYTVDFNAANLSSGIYFCNLSTGDFTSVKKMNLIK